jgi:BNR repeat protein
VRPGDGRSRRRAGGLRAEPAVAHHAGGVALARGANPPIPCTTVTGNAIEGATIGVTRSGAVFFASIEQNPDGVRTIVDPSVIARSTDRGASWSNIVPGGSAVSPHGSLSPWLRVDPVTSRLWYATPTAPCGATISWSDDDGETWGTNPNIGCPAQGGVALMEGPAPAGTPEPAGYPHVVYYCANAQDGEESVLVCHRSRDGGSSWELTGSTPDPVPPQPGCSPEELRSTRGGEVGPDGVLYFPTYSCDDRTLGLAVSRDQGDTWSRSKALEAEIQDLYPPALAIDTDGTLYVAWRGEGGLPYLTVSTDRGESWSAPKMIAPPGVNAMRRLGIVAREPGHIVVAYLASTDGGDSYDAYMTESRNAADAEPTFWSAVVNDPGGSVLKRGASELYANRIQLLRPHIADDGTPWAAFHCYETELCPGERLGLAAQLRRGSGAPCKRRRRVVLRVKRLRGLRVRRVVARVGRRRVGRSRTRRVRIDLSRVSGNRATAKVVLRVTGRRAGKRVRVKRVRRIRICMR